MAYEISTPGSQSTTGIRVAGAGEPNWPNPASDGSGAELSFASDIREDPADDDGCDPAVGWTRGVLGSQKA